MPMRAGNKYWTILGDRYPKDLEELAGSGASYEWRGEGTQGSSTGPLREVVDRRSGRRLKACAALVLWWASM